jgi:hypothetical protein
MCVYTSDKQSERAVVLMHAYMLKDKHQSHDDDDNNNNNNDDDDDDAKHAITNTRGSDEYTSHAAFAENHPLT